MATTRSLSGLRKASPADLSEWRALNGLKDMLKLSLPIIPTVLAEFLLRVKVPMCA